MNRFVRAATALTVVLFISPLCETAHASSTGKRAAKQSEVSAKTTIGYVRGKVSLRTSIVGKKGIGFTNKIWGPSGKVVLSEDRVMKADKMTSRRYLLSSWFATHGGNGTYRAEWYVGDRLIGKTRFEVRHLDKKDFPKSERPYQAVNMSRAGKQWKQDAKVKSTVVPGQIRSKDGVEDSSPRQDRKKDPLAKDQEVATDRKDRKKKD